MAGWTSAPCILVSCLFPTAYFIAQPQNTGPGFCLSSISPYFSSRSPCPDVQRFRAGHMDGAHETFII